MTVLITHFNVDQLDKSVHSRQHSKQGNHSDSTSLTPRKELLPSRLSCWLDNTGPDLQQSFYENNGFFFTFPMKMGSHLSLPSALHANPMLIRNLFFLPPICFDEILESGEALRGQMVSPVPVLSSNPTHKAKNPVSSKFHRSRGLYDAKIAPIRSRSASTLAESTEPASP